MEPLVSVVIPVFNGEKYIAEAVNSALDQDYSNLEVIVVDDGSTDATWSILKTFSGSANVNIYTHDRHENRGVSTSRKLGVDCSKGKYIAFLDADDIFAKDKVSRQVPVLENNLEVVLSHGNISLLSEVDSTPGFTEDFNLSSKSYLYQYSEEPYFLEKNRICNSTTLVRAEKLKGLDFSFPQLFQYEDYLLWVLLSEYGSFYYVPEKLVKYRYHRQSATAKVVNAPLMYLYSQLELFLALLTRVSDDLIRERINHKFKSILYSLTEEYAPSAMMIDEDKITELISETIGEAPTATIEFYAHKLALSRAELERIRSTLSWRITGPLRFWGRKFGLKKG